MNTIDYIDPVTAEVTQIPVPDDLTNSEAERLDACEQVIERGLATFVDVGMALLEVRDSRLYRAAYPTFEAYCAERWNLSPRHSNRLIQAAQVAENLGPMGPIPTNERQARELARLDPEAQREVWQAAVESAPNGQITAAHVRAVARINEALTAAPEAVREVVERFGVSDADTISELARLHKQRRDTFAEVAASGFIQPGDEAEAVHIADGALAVKRALVEKERTYRALALDDRRAALTATADGQYRVIYADPPWRYEHVETENRAIENHYPTLELADICALPVSALCADDAVLFLWATSPKLAEAMRVIEAWGFDYRTCMVWVKDVIGMGYYARQRHELLLIATKGHPPVPATDARPDSVQEQPRGRHSEKPERFYGLIERMYPTWPRIELFARASRAGWACLGNEIDGMDIRRVMGAHYAAASTEQ